MRIFSLIVSLWLAVSALAAITDRYVTDAGSGAADGTSVANAMSYATFTDYMVTGGSFTAAAGDRFNIIGTITGRTTTTDTWVNGGSSTSPVVVRGWTSGGVTAYAGRSNGNGALITTDFPVITYTTGRINISGSWIVLECLSISGNPSSAVVTLGSECVIKSCSITNSSTNASAAGIAGTSTGNITLDCDAFLTGASGGNCAINAQAGASVVDSCRVSVVSSTASGINCNNTSVIYGNLIYGNGGVGILMPTTTGRPWIRSNTIVGCGGNGIDIVTGATVLQRIIGNMVTDNGGFGVDLNSASVGAFVAYNRTRDNTSGAYGLATDWVAATSFEDVTTDTGGQSTDYTNAGSSDFSLIRLSPATSAGLPAYSSIGALQRDQTTASGGQSAFAY